MGEKALELGCENVEEFEEVNYHYLRCLGMSVLQQRRYEEAFRLFENSVGQVDLFSLTNRSGSWAESPFSEDITVAANGSASEALIMVAAASGTAISPQEPTFSPVPEQSTLARKKTIPTLWSMGWI